VEAHLAGRSGPVSLHLVEQLAERDVSERPVHHESLRAGGVMADEIDDGARESRIAHVGAGDQEIAAEAHGSLRLRRPLGRRGREQRHRRDEGGDEMARDHAADVPVGQYSAAGRVSRAACARSFRASGSRGRSAARNEPQKLPPA
jgi:hypothetical protein